MCEAGLQVKGHPSWGMDEEWGLVRQRGARNVQVRRAAYARARGPDRAHIFEELKNFNSYVKVDIRGKW